MENFYLYNLLLDTVVDTMSWKLGNTTHVDPL